MHSRILREQAREDREARRGDGGTTPDNSQFHYGTTFFIPLDTGNVEHILETIKQEMVQRIVLLFEDLKGDETNLIQQNAQSIEEFFRNVQYQRFVAPSECVMRYAFHHIDIMERAFELIQLIEQEQTNRDKICINIATSNQNLAISCYIAALISRIRIST